MDVREAIRAIKERVSIVDLARRYVDLKPCGPRFTAPCPFHQETKPSFSVNPDKGVFYCFGCQASGDIFEFYGKINGLDFRDTLLQLADEAGITVEFGKNSVHDQQKSANDRAKRLDLLRMHELAATHFRACLSRDSGDECLAYLDKRGISPEIMEQFGLGWAERSWNSLANALRTRGFKLADAADGGLLSRSANGNLFDRFRGRLMFPIKNLSGQVIAFGGRIIADEDEAKYINSADTPLYRKKEHLFGLAQARRAISAQGFAILTEGYMDVLTLHQYGYENSVGVLGTALTTEQIQRLSGFTSRLVLVFDGDRAGRKAALRSCEMLLARGLACNVVLLPDGEDIDSLLRGAGHAAFAELMSSAPDGLSFCIRTLQSLAPKEAVEWARNFLGQIKIPELGSPYATALAQKLRISEQELRQDAISHASDGKVSTTPRQQLLNVRDTQIITYAVRYPERLCDLRQMGADLALVSPAARNFWDLLEEFGPEDVFYHLNERQKQFWLAQRGEGSAPRDNAKLELALLGNELASFYSATQKASLAAALTGGAGDEGFAADLEYLRALQETIGEKNEQS